MKILYGTYPWAYDCPGGGERQLLSWKNNLAKIDVNVSLFNAWNSKITTYKIFHFFSVMPGSIHFCNYVKSKGLKLLITPNIWVTPETKKNYLHDEIERLLKLSDGIVVNSKMEAQSLSNVYNQAIDKFHVVYNGVEEIFFKNIDENIFLDKFSLRNQRYIITIANVEPRKNQLILSRAIKKFPDLKLVLIGSIRDSDYFNQCTQENKNQIIYAGNFDYASDLIRSAIKGSVGFILPSLLETPSIAALEAGAMGINVLITSEGSTNEYFEDFVLYCDPNTESAISEGISKLLQKDKKNLMLSDHIYNNFRVSESVYQLKKVYEKYTLLSKCH
jgi:glycosyltransferase involved in cell wall biosynthesis